MCFTNHPPDNRFRVGPLGADPGHTIRSLLSAQIVHNGISGQALLCRSEGILFPLKLTLIPIRNPPRVFLIKLLGGSVC